MDKGVRKLRYFVEVARCKSYRRAAEQLFVSQPPLTRQIKSLEDELGVELIHRTSRTFALTDAGVRAHDIFAACLSRLDRAITNVIAAGRRDDAKFRLGVPWWLDLKRIEAFNQLARSFLGYDGVEITVCGNAECADRVLDGVLDAGIVVDPVDNQSLAREAVSVIGLLAAVPQHHPLAAHARIPVNRLGELPALVLLSSRSNPLQHRSVINYCLSMGLPARTLVVVDDPTSLLQYVASGRAAALFNDFSCSSLDLSGVAFRPLPGSFDLKSQISLISRPDNRIPLPAKLRDAICAMLRPTLALATEQHAAAHREMIERILQPQAA